MAQKTFEERWDERIMFDLKVRMNTFDRRWRRHRDLVDNTKRQKQPANLTSQFTEIVETKLIVRDPTVKVRVDDPARAMDAQELQVASNHIARVAGLRDVLMETALDSLWAGTGWMEVGHTLAVTSMDIDRTLNFQNTNQVPAGEVQSRFEQVPEEEVRGELGDRINDIKGLDQFDATVAPDLFQPTEPEPEPKFDSDVGLPWLARVNPFMVIVPHDTRKFENADYVSKIIPMSLEELKELTDFDLESQYYDNRFKEIFKEVPGFDKWVENKVMLCVTYIRRDRNDPKRSSWYMVHVLGHPDVLIASMRNPYGGLIPIIPVKPDPKQAIWGESPASKLETLGKWFDMGVRAIGDRIKESLNQKLLKGSNSDLGPDEENNLLDPDFKGTVKVNGDVEQIKRWEGPGISAELLEGIQLVQSLAQGASNQSQIERGQEVRRITARQTEALLASSNLKVTAIRRAVAFSAAEGITKAMHFVGLFSQGVDRRFQWGNRIADIDPGTMDFTNSVRYSIDVVDMESPPNAEQQLIFVNFLAKVAQDEWLKQHYNGFVVADQARKIFNQPPEMMNPPPPPMGQQNPQLELDGVGPGGLSLVGGGPEGGGAVGPRTPGDQGSVPGIQQQLGGLLNG